MAAVPADRTGGVYPATLGGFVLAAAVFEACRASQGQCKQGPWRERRARALTVTVIPAPGCLEAIFVRWLNFSALGMPVLVVHRLCAHGL